jgi:hypothetical protein
MKKIQRLFIANNLLLLLVFRLPEHSKAQLANSYPHDSLIQTDPKVVFAEMFEQNSVSTMISNSGYQTSQLLSNISFDTSVPPGSHGRQSLKLTTIESSNASNDPNEDANILKRFSSGINDSVFVRYYVKFNSGHTFHHSGVWMGGTNSTLSCWPCNKPGRTIPTNGDSAFVVGSEIRGNANISAQAFSKFGFYNYWMDMNPFTTGPNAGQYFGNEFISPNSNSSINMDAWNCIEVMIKLNNPVIDSTGELKLWINGQLLAHYGKGLPNGTWNEAIFIEGTGTPFEGFRWRSNPAVVFNYIWIKNYSTNNTSFPSANDILYDHVVVAKSYIGPIYNPVTTGIRETNSEFPVAIYPNPANEVIKLSTTIELVRIFNSYGQKIAEKTNADLISTAGFPDGMYLLQINNNFRKIMVKH